MKDAVASEKGFHKEIKKPPSDVITVLTSAFGAPQFQTPETKTEFGIMRWYVDSKMLQYIHGSKFGTRSTLVVSLHGHGQDQDEFL